MELELLLNRYEKGQISRRELLGALSAIAMAAPAAAADPPAIGTAEQLNHVTLFVQDVQKSVAFYQSLFGMPVLTPQGPGLGLDKFDADVTLTRLKDRGLDANVRLRGDTKELYFTDPDKIRVQLQDVRYRGGVGPLGDRDPK